MPAWSASTISCTARTCAPTSTLREGAERPAALELIRFARERIGYKAPEEIVFLDQMPRTASGKVDRSRLKRMAEAGATPSA